MWLASILFFRQVYIFFLKSLKIYRCISEWCQDGQYVCANAKQCIEMYRVCDGTPDCPLGDDEKSCVALADELEDNEVVPYNDEGKLDLLS